MDECSGHSEPDDSVVGIIGYIDVRACINCNTVRPAELPGAAAVRADGGPSLSVDIVHAYDPVIAVIRDIDMPAGIDRYSGKVVELIGADSKTAERGPARPAHVIHAHYPTVALVR